jgi:hypothetical protein
MSRKERKSSDSNPSEYVARSEFQQVTAQIKDEAKIVKLALFGEDMRGGMVKDVADIKASLRLWSQLKTFGLGIAATVIAAIIIAVATGAI